MNDLNGDLFGGCVDLAVLPGVEAGLAQAGWRLPSEAQWEYAARGAKKADFPSGDEPPSPERLNAGRHEPGAIRLAAGVGF